MYMMFCLNVLMCTILVALRGQKANVRNPGTEVTSGCESHVGAGNQMLVLCKSSKHSCKASHLNDIVRKKCLKGFN